MAQASSALLRDMERRAGSMGETEALPTVEPDLLAALVVFLAAGALDLLDGVAARRMKQCSRLGALLDVVADNVLRGCMWVSSALLDARTALPALICISVEWLTLLASQLLQHREQGRHWKKLRTSEPWVVRYFFSNNFRNVLGVYGVGSLFLAPLFPLCLHAVPGLGRRAGALSEGRGEGWGGGRGGGGNRDTGGMVVRGVGYALGGGRLVSLGVEMYFVWGLVKALVEEQGRERKAQGPRAET